MKAAIFVESLPGRVQPLHVYLSREKDVIAVVSLSGQDEGCHSCFIST
jgi:hypothetical protein